MKKWVVAALLLTGCMEENVGPAAATPIARPQGGPPIPPPQRAPPPPVAAVEPPPAAVEEPKGPQEPAGLTRSKVGDQLEFSWTRTGSQTVDPAAAMAMISTGQATNQSPEALKKLMMPRAANLTGTVSLTRVLPETPFTVRIEIKQGKSTEQLTFSYAKDVPLEKILYRTDSADPRKPQKAAGRSWECVETPSRFIAPDADALALSGGLVSENTVETTPGSLSVALTRVSTGKPAAARGEVKVLDSYETPIAIAITKIQKFGTVDPDAKSTRDDQLTGLIQKTARPCVTGTGALELVITGRKIESMLWEKARPLRAFEQCVRGKLKKLKLPDEETFVTASYE